MILPSCSLNIRSSYCETIQSETGIIVESNASETAVTTSISESVTSIVNQTALKNEVFKPTLSTEEKKYLYIPPNEAYEAEFVVDNIVHKLDFKYYRNDGTSNLPSEIVSEINYYVNEGKAENEHLEWLGEDRFDMNSDGVDDYIIEGHVTTDNPFYFTRIVRMYISNNNMGFDAVDIPSSKYDNNDYILSTKTNNYNDYLGHTYSNGFSLMCFDGEDAYSVSRTLGKEYTWEYLDDNLLKITYSYSEGTENEYAIAKPLFGANVLENTLLYSSLSDGTPTVCDSEKIEFYIRLTDNAPKNPNDFWIGPIEFEYISANDSN